MYSEFHPPANDRVPLAARMADDGIAIRGGHVGDAGRELHGFFYIERVAWRAADCRPDGDDGGCICAQFLLQPTFYLRDDRCFMSHQVVAVFDLDGTITRGDTYLAFLFHVLLRRPQRVAQFGTLALAVGKFKLGRLSRDKLKSCFLTAIVGGSRRGEVTRYVDSFLLRRLGRMIKPAAVARIDWHRAQGHYLILASASVDLYVPRLGTLLRFDKTICTQTAWLNDRLTGVLDGMNLRGEAKLAALRKMLGNADPPPKVFAYSDHHSDLPLLQFADHAIAVDPNDKLRANARANGIAVEYW